MNGRFRRSTAIAVIGVAVALVTAGLVVGWLLSHGDDRAGTPGTGTPCQRQPPASAPPATTAPDPAPPKPVDPSRGVPVRLRIPSLDVDAAVLPVVTDASGTLAPPDSVRKVGWWADGAEAGSRRGTVVCTGHTVRSGGGVFDDLPRVRPGARVRLTTAAGSVDYTVTDVRQIPKDDFAAAAPQVFDQSVPARLVLVTCSDYRFGRFRANTVVVARPTGESARYAD